MSNLILVRHGLSVFNKKNIATGWLDVDLAKEGEKEAEEAGLLIKELNIKFDFAFSSIQKRALNTLNIILKTIAEKNISVVKNWALNEKHYGILQNKNKDEIKKKYGEEKVKQWRRSWDIAPPPLDHDDLDHPLNMEIYKNINRNLIPDTESLKNTYERAVSYWKENIETKLLNNKNIIVVAHGNSLRAILKYLFKISNEKISSLEVPTGNPLLIFLDNNLNIKKFNYLNETRAKSII